MTLEKQHCRIVQKIQTYDADSVVCLGILLLQYSTGNPTRTIAQMQDMRKTIPDPWIIMLLIRWALQNQKKCHRSVRIRLDEFFQLCSEISFLHESEEIIKSFSKLTQFGRVMRMLNQQIVYQNRWEEIQTSVARQQYWFYELDKGGHIRAMFEKATGVPVRHFLEMYYMCFDFIAKNVYDLNYDMFARRIVDPVAEPGIMKFLSTLSLGADGAMQFLMKHTSTHTKSNPSDGIGFQIFEPTPLERYPLFVDGNMYRPYSPAMLVHSMRHNVYRILMEYSDGSFGGLFGPVFEKYVGMGLNYCCSDVKDERWIKKTGLKERKSVDFFVGTKTSAIFVDAKSTELPLVPRVLQSGVSIIHHTEKNIIKGMQQIVSTCSHFISTDRICSKSELYGVVVTYENYFLTWEVYCEYARNEVLAYLFEEGSEDLVGRIRFVPQFAD